MNTCRNCYYYEAFNEKEGACIIQEAITTVNGDDKGCYYFTERDKDEKN